MNNSENFFRLLVPATDVTPSGTPSIELGGKRWVLTEWMPISEAPPYTCISYSWGTERTENMFEAGHFMSDRTIPSIEATIRATQSPAPWIKPVDAIWIDALCVPPNNPARTVCLQSMGAIYSSATQVFAALSKSCAQALQKINDTVPLEISDLLTIENDDWITRAWTYQEMGNSKSTIFIALDDGNSSSLALDFLNATLDASTDYANAQGFKRTELAARFPKIDSLENMIAEHRLVEFAGRSAYQVMSTMQPRFATQEEDRIYAMIGVITTQTSNTLKAASMQPAEYFMKVCEEKGDYSFIYCTAPRSDIPGRSWRPVADQLQPVLSGLLASGSGLSGCLKETHLQLDNMYRMTPRSLNSIAKSIGNFLHDNIATALLERLRQKGFTGCGEYLELENGYFFPQSSFTRSKYIFVVASPDVQWEQGAPALLLRSNGTDINQFCDVGVFIGCLPKDGESINVG